MNQNASNVKGAPAVAVQRVFRPDPRTFTNLPPDSKCPICGTNDDGKTVLVEIAGTAKDGIAEAKPMHLACAVAKQWDEGMGIALTWPNGELCRVRQTTENMNEAQTKLNPVTVSTPSGGSAAFPIMEGSARRSDGDLKSIPWAMIAPHDATAQQNHGGQNLIGLAQRGGLCPLEAVAVLEDVHYRKRWPDSYNDRSTIEKATLEARAILKQMVANWTPPNEKS